METERDYIETLRRARDNDILYITEEELDDYLRRVMEYAISSKIFTLTPYHDKLYPGWDVEWL